MSINLRQILFNLSYLTLSNIAAKLAGFIFLVAIARTYGSYEYGIFALVSTGLMFAIIFADFGLDYFLIRFFHEHTDFKAFKTIVELKSLLALTAFIGINAWARLLYSNPLLGRYVLLLSITIFPDALFKIIIAYFRSRNDFRRPSLIMIGFNVAKASLAVAIMSRPMEFSHIFLVLIVLEFAKCLAIISLFWNKISFSLGHLSPGGPMGRILKDAFPFALGSVSGLLLWQVDIYLISYVKGFHAVGVYSAANAVLTAAVDVPLMLAAAIFPNLLNTSPPQMRKGFFGIVKWVLPLAMGAACALFFMAPWIMGPLFKMSESTEILQILCWSIIPVAIYSVMAPFIYKLGGVLEVSYITIFGIIYVAALDFIFLRYFGVWVAALVDVTAEFALLFCYAFSLRKRLAQKII